MIKLQTLTSTDKILLAAVLLNAGVKARIKTRRVGFRVCFVGLQADVISALNDNDFRDASGSAFTLTSFNQPHEIFVRYMAA